MSVNQVFSTCTTNSSKDVHTEYLGMGVHTFEFMIFDILVILALKEDKDRIFAAFCMYLIVLRLLIRNSSSRWFMTYNNIGS